MSNQKFIPSASPPPPAYGTDGTNISSPEPAHTQSTYYGASANAEPYGGPPQNYPPQNYPPQQEQGQGQGGYYAPGPQMYQQPQGGYYPPGPQYQQQGFQQGGYQQGPYGPGYGQQGGYYNDRQGRGSSDGFMGALLASLACCCCLDACLLF